MRSLYCVGVMMLACAGGVLAFSAGHWSYELEEGESIVGSSGIEQFRIGGYGREGEAGFVSPLVAQATAFALYLDPPRPPAPVQAVRPQAAPPAPRPVAAVAPKFRLLLTSCHRSHPDESLALISEPGRGDHWIRKGDTVGHLVVEEVKDGALVYRDGGQLREVTVVLKRPVELATVASTSSAAQAASSDVRLVNAFGAGQSGMQGPNARPGDYEQE